MKPLTKNILIGLAVAITIVLILLIILFVVMYVMLVIEKNEEHRKLGHCVPLIDSALETEEDFYNSTKTLLSNPSNYKELADECEKAINCVGTVDSFVSADVLHTFSSCQFYVFYNRQFASCAEKLIMKKDGDAACLKRVFDDSEESTDSRCKEWDNIQKCIKTQIGITCGDEMTKRYEEEAANLRSSICMGGESLV
ncbi:hypothetical protein CRE_14894 [Caenorhabditis remanei]|uniref:T20D4.11-like domain-containing protein n=1 Tax=Caenorhabditis remanei TaxID=31234 RepID=E3N1X9_CAERE|nr:hypothetical protein CRE_14894 [Caenorhabditis remanei]